MHCINVVYAFAVHCVYSFCVFFSFLRCIIRICVNGLDFYFHLGELKLQTQPTVRQIPVLLRCLPFNIICVHQSIAGCTFFFRMFHSVSIGMPL